MRPIPNAMHLSRGGVGVQDDDLATPTPAPMACFITTEAGLDASSNPPSRSPTVPVSHHRKRSGGNVSSRTPGSRSRSRASSPALTSASLASLSSSALDLDLEPGTPHYHSPSLPPTRNGLSSVSVISSISSRRHSIAVSSQPESEHLSGRSTDAESQHGDSQFIMPSLRVPQRRPFSLSGKSVGKLKILIAGPPGKPRTTAHSIPENGPNIGIGTGKGTIIQAISQCCEHIVHMDHVVPSSTRIMNEVYASTRPRSLWHSHISSENSAQRRRSMSEVLDRNLCFVVRSPQRRPFPSMESEMRYLDSQLRSVLEKPLDDSDLWSLLTNGGQPNVDLVLYMVPQIGRLSVAHFGHSGSLTY